MELNNVYIITCLDGCKSPSTVIKTIVMWKGLGFNVTVISQNHDKDTFDGLGVNVIDCSFFLSPAQARNFALQLHYGSDDDFCIISDDDVILEKCNELFFNMKEQSINQFNNIDIIIPRINDDLMYNKRYMVFSTSDSGIGGLFLIKNLRKYNKQPVYFDVAFRHTSDGLISGEDHEFIYNCYVNGYGAYESSDLIVSHIEGSSWRGSSKLSDDFGHRIYNDKYSERKDIIQQYYKIRKLL